MRPGPAGGARDENRRERTAAICNGALALFLERGVDAVSIDQIARRAGIGKASFYSYFQDKRELVATLVDPVRAAVLQAMDHCLARIERAQDFGSFRYAQEQMVADLLEAFSDRLDLLRLLLQEARGPAIGARQPIRAFHDEIVERAVGHNEAALRARLIRDIHPRLMAYINLGAIERLGAGFLAGTDLGDPREAVRMLADVMLTGLERP